MVVQNIFMYIIVTHVMQLSKQDDVVFRSIFNDSDDDDNVADTLGLTNTTEDENVKKAAAKKTVTEEVWSLDKILVAYVVFMLVTVLLGFLL